MRQLAMRNEKDHTFINMIQEVIEKYKLEPVEKLDWHYF
jgi:DNA-directed RNA polymerase subunit L